MNSFELRLFSLLFFNFFWENKSRIEMTNFLLLKVQEFFLNWFHFHTFPASRAFDWKLGLKRVVHCTPVLLWMVLKLDHFFFWMGHTRNDIREPYINLDISKIFSFFFSFCLDFLGSPNYLFFSVRCWFVKKIFLFYRWQWLFYRHLL